MAPKKSIAAMMLAGATLWPAAQARPSPSQRSSAATQERAADPLADSEALLEKKQYAQGEEKLQALMAAQGKNPQAWFDLGFAQSHLGKTQEAISSYQKAVELAPDWFEANLNLGGDLAQSGNRAAAVTVLKHAVELKPTSGGQQAVGGAWLSLAQVMEEDGSDPKGAAAAYDKAAELNPAAGVDLALRAGSLLEKAGDLAGAEEHYRKAAATGNARAMAQLIDLLRAQKRYTEAETWLNKYVAQNPQDAVARAQLAQLLAADGKSEEAIAILEAAGTASGDPKIRRALASLYLEEKQYDKAAKILQDLVQGNLGDAQLHWDFGSVLLHQHKYPEAEKELLEALKINPRLEGDYWELAYAAQQNKHYELAIRVLDVRAKRLPETPATYWIRAVSYDSLGALKPAAANYKLFLAADAGKSPDQEFQARHRIKAIEPQR